MDCDGNENDEKIPFTGCCFPPTGQQSLRRKTRSHKNNEKPPKQAAKEELTSTENQLSQSLTPSAEKKVDVKGDGGNVGHNVEQRYEKRRSDTEIESNTSPEEKKAKTSFDHFVRSRPMDENITDHLDDTMLSFIFSEAPKESNGQKLTSTENQLSQSLTPSAEKKVDVKGDGGNVGHNVEQRYEERRSDTEYESNTSPEEKTLFDHLVCSRPIDANIADHLDDIMSSYLFSEAPKESNGQIGNPDFPLRTETDLIDMMHTMCCVASAIDSLPPASTFSKAQVNGPNYTVIPLDLTTREEGETRSSEADNDDLSDIEKMMHLYLIDSNDIEQLDISLGQCSLPTKDEPATSNIEHDGNQRWINPNIAVHTDDQSSTSYGEPNMQTDDGPSTSNSGLKMQTDDRPSTSNDEPVMQKGDGTSNSDGEPKVQIDDESSTSYGKTRMQTINIE